MVLWLLLFVLFQIKNNNKPTDFKTILIERSKKIKFLCTESAQTFLGHASSGYSAQNFD